ncbi:MAG: hypothetical protein HC888_01930 [Candidatus Competibacteraceae bacterium]|nr:hypothetical protein [Candidatus Competibacteraceae bacterium]
MAKKNEQNANPLTENGAVVAKQIDFTELNGKFIHVKVGAPEGSASLVGEEIKKVQDDLVKLLEDNNIDCLLYVSHEFVNIQIIESRR